MVIDYGAGLCLSLRGLDPRGDLAVRRARQGPWPRPIFAVPFGKDVCFAYGGGDTEGTLDKVLRAMGPTPWSHMFGRSTSARLHYGKPVV